MLDDGAQPGSEHHSHTHAIHREVAQLGKSGGFPNTVYSARASPLEVQKADMLGKYNVGGRTFLAFLAFPSRAGLRVSRLPSLSLETLHAGRLCLYACKTPCQCLPVLLPT
jgi:hypothetical protein